MAVTLSWACQFQTFAQQFVRINVQAMEFAMRIRAHACVIRFGCRICITFGGSVRPIVVRFAFEFKHKQMHYFLSSWSLLIQILSNLIFLLLYRLVHFVRCHWCFHHIHSNFCNLFRSHAILSHFEATHKSESSKILFA